MKGKPGNGVELKKKKREEKQGKAIQTKAKKRKEKGRGRNLQKKNQKEYYRIFENEVESGFQIHRGYVCLK